MVRVGSVGFVFALVVAAACSGPTPPPGQPPRIPPVEPPPPPPPTTQPPAKPKPRPEPVCAAQLRAALAPSQRLFVAIADGASPRCIGFRANAKSKPAKGSLFHGHTFSGQGLVAWRKVFRVALSYRRTANQLELFWLGTGSAVQKARCGKFMGVVGVGFGLSGPPQTCGGPRTATRCDANAIETTNGTLYLSEAACTAAVKAGAKPWSLGTCDQWLVAGLAKARTPPSFDKPVSAAAARMAKLLGKKRWVYWLDLEDKRTCLRWRVKPDADKPGALVLERKGRKGRKRIRQRQDAHLWGIELSLGILTTEESSRTGQPGVVGALARNQCLRIESGGKRHVLLEAGHGFFTSRRACLRARRRALKKRTSAAKRESKPRPKAKSKPRPRAKSRPRAKP